MKSQYRHRDRCSRKNLASGKIWWAVILFFILLPGSLACRLTTHSENTPAILKASPFPTLADPLALPQPADQSSAMLTGTPPIPEDLNHYTIRLDIDYLGHSFNQYTRVDYTNTENVALDRLYFRLYPNLGQSYGDGRIMLNTARINGQQVETKTSSFDSIVEVKLPALLYPGDQTTVEMETEGSVPVDFGGGELNTGYGMYNYSQGVLALANFYPILAVYESGGWWLDPVYGFGDSVFSDAAYYTVEVLSDPSLILATSGKWVSQQKVGDRLMRRYISGPARDFFIIGSPEFKVISRQVGNTIVNSYYLPQNPDGGAQALETAARSLEIFTSLFGPYPYMEYDIVEAPLNLPSGIEFPALGLIAERLYGDYEYPDFNATVAHEVAHQWWYNVVGSDVHRTPGMDEALATYSSILYWEEVGGAVARQQALDYYWDKYNPITQKGWDAPILSPMSYFQENNRPESYSPIVYAKGALFYEELRKKIGDDAFLKALQFYYGTHWFTVASTSELLGAFQAATQIDLGDLYDTWLFSPQVDSASPTLTVTPIHTETATPTPEPTYTLTPEPTSTPEPQPLVFAAIGDYGGADEETQDVAELMASWQPEFIITVGDNNYPFGAANHIDAAVGQFFHQFIYPYQGKYGQGADTNRFFPTLGNHDTFTEDGKPYFDYFTLPGNERYYDFEWGPVHLYALDLLDTEPDGFRATSVQATWLQDRLAASTSPWNIVYGHYPPYSSGLHGATEWARWPFAEWGVDAVLSGHDHTYERLLVDGVTYFVNGMGGFALYDFGKAVAGSQVRYNDEYGAIRVEATNDYLLFQFINRNDELVDQVELWK